MTFEIGDLVNYTNDNGVDWGERRIVGTEVWDGYTDTRYFIEPTDTPWYSHDERNLRLIARATTRQSENPLYGLF